LLPHINPTENWKVEGYVKILFTCNQRSSNITLHSYNTTIDHSSITVTDVNDNTIETIGFGVDEERQFLFIHLHDELLNGHEYKLEISHFESFLNDEMTAFYRSAYSVGDVTK
jgi:hypothetical protein